MSAGPHMAAEHAADSGADEEERERRGAPTPAPPPLELEARTPEARALDLSLIAFRHAAWDIGLSEPGQVDDAHADRGLLLEEVQRLQRERDEDEGAYMCWRRRCGDAEATLTRLVDGIESMATNLRVAAEGADDAESLRLFAAEVDALRGTVTR